jgi:hypothetical protein
LQGIASIEEVAYVEPESGLHVYAAERTAAGFGTPWTSSPFGASSS